MGQMMAYHFHGYQPGDIVRRLPTSPTKPMKWEERRSPVEVSVGDRSIAGRNWTDCMLACYSIFMEGLRDLGEDMEGFACSLDIEPFTLEMLLSKDAREGRDTYGQFRALVEAGTVDPVVTTPFHPFLPYLHPFEQEVLAALAFDFYGPFLRASPDSVPPVAGVWLSEAGYTLEAAATFARAFWAREERRDHHLYYLLDGRQFLEPPGGYHLWSLNFLDLGVGRSVYVYGRDVELSDAFAFGSRSVEEMVDMVLYDRVDAAKEEHGIPYIITIASDLEALAGSPAHLGRFRELVTTLHSVESWPTTHRRFLQGKLGGGMPTWEGEGRDEAFRATVKEYSSWSDYPDHMSEGRTGDTRWQGMRRVDGLVISRMHQGRQVSQVWKQALLALESQVEGQVRRALGAVLRSQVPHSTRSMAVDFLVAYGRLVLHRHYLRQGFAPRECGFEVAIGLLDSPADTEALALAARAYFEMLMGLRSDACFWDNIDTRVTFQNVVMLTHALVDMAEACGRVGEEVHRERLLSVLRSHLLGFDSLYHLCRLGTLSGRHGWESTEEAWLQAIQSEVPAQSPYDVVRRAALFALQEEVPKGLEGALDCDPSLVVAATGHIEGEAHGNWARKDYCEHRGRS